MRAWKQGCNWKSVNLPDPTNPFKIWNWWCTGGFHFWLLRLQKQKVQIYWSLEVFQWEKNSINFSSSCVLPRGAMVAHLISAQKVVCSTHAKVKMSAFNFQVKAEGTVLLLHIVELTIEEVFFVQEQLYLFPKLPKLFLATNWTLWQNCVICFLITSGSMNFWGCLFRKHVGQNYGASRVVK